jgi:hypothetical protein
MTMDRGGKPREGKRVDMLVCFELRLLSLFSLLNYFFI